MAPAHPRSSIYGHAGVGTVTGVGTMTNYAEMLTPVRTLLDANLSLEDATRVAIMSPRVWEVYEALATGITSNNTQLPRPRDVAGHRVFGDLKRQRRDHLQIGCGVHG